MMPAADAILTVSGFIAVENLVSAVENLVSNLVIADVGIISTDTCNEYYGGSLTPGMICAAGTGEDSCQSDSGNFNSSIFDEIFIKFCFLGRWSPDIRW